MERKKRFREAENNYLNWNFARTHRLTVPSWEKYPETFNAHQQPGSFFYFSPERHMIFYPPGVLQHFLLAQHFCIPMAFIYCLLQEEYIVCTWICGLAEQSDKVFSKGLRAVSHNKRYYNPPWHLSPSPVLLNNDYLSQNTPKSMLRVSQKKKTEILQIKHFPLENKKLLRNIIQQELACSR